jgi:hypothetical protein
LKEIHDKLALFSNTKVCLEGTADGMMKYTKMLRKMKNVDLVLENCDLTIDLKLNSSAEIAT